MSAIPSQADVDQRARDLGSGAPSGRERVPYTKSVLSQRADIARASESAARTGIFISHCGVLFRGGVEERIRRKLLVDGHIDTVIGLPANLFYSTGIPVCILVLKKCKRPDDVLFINAAERFVKGTRQNQLTDQHLENIVTTYQHRKEQDRYARRVSMKEIAENDYNLNISRYVSTSLEEAEVDLAATHAELVRIEGEIAKATAKHNKFLKELGLPRLPSVSVDAS
jgi:type I restriction enzyme M protein